MAPWQLAQWVRYRRWAGVAVLGIGWGRKSEAARLPAASSAAGPAMIRSHFRFIGRSLSCRPLPGARAQLE
ncbi:MAG: hypothetical protein A2X53_09355 [Candidatus Rokubacteria bacterium GWA2_70_23]|nr:MAG: hypothetical protein A2X53_09355 [Candidatus Rokubacteria bacterium GWA2_70_23]